MSANIPIIELKATHYNFISKKWVPGTFILNPTNVTFQVEENERNDSFKNARISMRSISGIERRQSSLIYPALIITSGLEKHWFASFANRDAVFNVLELFWKQPLLPSSPSQPRPASSALGKELLGILHESENSLAEAASALSSQGIQLQESEAVLSDVNVDLTKAQTILRNMSFLGSVSALFSNKPKAIKPLDEQERRQKHYSVTFTFDKSKMPLYNWEAGTLVASSDLTLLDEQRHTKMSLSSDEVGNISVLSPWEFCIAYNSNDTTQSCHIMCSQLKSLIKFLISFPAWRSKTIQDKNPFCKSEPGPSATSSTIPSLPSILSLNSVQSSNAEQIQELQASNTEKIIDQESVISQQDMNEISNMLNNLQVLATDVCREQKDQMDRINTILTDVDKTELRIRAHNKEIKKFM